MKTKLSSLFLAVALAAGSLFCGAKAQEEPVLSLRAPARVAAGQAFEVSYAINTRGSKNFQAPAFKGLDILFGPAQSQSSSFQFVNGKQSQSFTLSYTYQLRAPKAGSYDFGKASIEVGGTTYYSEPFTLTVTDAPQQAQTQTQGADRSDSRRERTSASVNGEDLYIKGSVSNRQPYVGEQVLLTYRIYTSIPVEQYSIYKTHSNKGFWTEELQVDPQSQRQENINGKQFVSADIRKVALFAQQAGSHTLEPLEVEAVAQVQAPRRARQSRSIFDIFEDDFFGSPTELVKKDLRSQSIRIPARHLPDEHR
ncbi:MAG: BatD family protein, partial [Bacteroidales bacterium]|nr:BatD family protein [Bacteroidales bacterium]